MSGLGMPPFPVILPRGKNRRRVRAGRVMPASRRSARLYVYLDPSKVHLFRYLLEAEDNLGLMTVVDRWRAALMVRFSPHQEREVRDFLEAVKPMVALEGPFVPGSNKLGNEADGAGWEKESG